MVERVKTKEKILSPSHQQMLEDGCPRECLREITAKSIEAVEMLRRMALEPPRIRISHPRDVEIRTHPEAPDGLGKPAKKKDVIAQLLLRKEGCTVADVLAATGWTKAAMPSLADAAGLKLRKVKEGDVTRYFGSK
jgi:hypothetical protein